jgi:periplasmic protein TonB
MDTLQAESRAKEPELKLLLSETVLHQPLWKSLIQNVEEFLFRKRMPPLVLTSTPLPVKDIWGFYDHKRDGVLWSTVVHVMVLLAVIGLTILGRRAMQQIQTPQATVTLVAPDDLLPMRPSRTRVGGGGGGGDRDKLQASKGRLPKFSMQQLTPPTVVVRNDNPKLAAEPTVVIPPQVVLATNQLPMVGDPISHLLSAPPSNGTGSGSGIGSGNGGGVGSGEGPGVGPGRGGGIGGGVFRIGGGVSAPRPIFTPDPEYSEEARKAKYQGTCVLWLVVGPDGKTRDIKVARTLGLGLDEKAIEAVKQWKFEPAMKGDTPVAVQVNVEVTFRLY